MNQTFLTSFHIAGFSYYEGALIFHKLKIGSKLKLVLDEVNIHDEHAIMLKFQGHKIGYVPRKHNKEIALLMKAGYKIFVAIVQQIAPEQHPAEQIRVGVFVEDK